MHSHYSRRPVALARKMSPSFDKFAHRRARQSGKLWGHKLQIGGPLCCCPSLVAPGELGCLLAVVGEGAAGVICTMIRVNPLCDAWSFSVTESPS